MDFGTFFSFVLLFIAAVAVWSTIKIVPQQQAWIIEKLGRFDRKLEPGLNILLPFLEKAAYKHSLKEQALDVHEQTAITRDNVTLLLDGVIYVKIIDAVNASYGVSDPIYAIIQLAQTTMRAEIGRITMDQTFEDREQLNANIVATINEAAQSWGVQCMRYEIKNINPPTSVLKAMEMQVAAERQKRADILQSEGKRQSQINIAEAEKQAVVLESEASKIDQINRAQGEAEAILAVAGATAEGIEKVAASIQKTGGEEAVALKIAEQYVAAFSKLAQKGTTILLPTNAGDAGSMVAQALTIFNSIKSGGGKEIVAKPWGNSGE